MGKLAHDQQRHQPPQCGGQRRLAGEAGRGRGLDLAWSLFTVAEGVHSSNTTARSWPWCSKIRPSTESRSVTLLYGAQNPAGDTFHVGWPNRSNLANPSSGAEPQPGHLLRLPAGGPVQHRRSQQKTDELVGRRAGRLLRKVLILARVCGVWQRRADHAGGIGDTTEDPPRTRKPPTRRVKTRRMNRLRAATTSSTACCRSSATAKARSRSTPTTPPTTTTSSSGLWKSTEAAAVVGEGLTVSPTSGTNKVGESHTVDRKRAERLRRSDRRSGECSPR